MKVCSKCKHVITWWIFCDNHGKSCSCICNSDGDIREPLTVLTKQRKLEMMSP